MKIPQYFRRPGLIPGLAVLFLCLVGSTHASGETLKKIIPKNTDVVVSVNVRAIADSDIFKEILAAHPVINLKIQQVQAFIGINLLQDVDRVTVYGPMKPKADNGLKVKERSVSLAYNFEGKSETWIFEGRFDTQRLLTMVQSNPQYKKTERDGVTIHEWLDAKENRVKYGTITPDGAVVIWTAKDALEASIEAAKDPSKALASRPEVAMIPKEAAQAAVVALAIDQQGKSPAAKYGIHALFGMLTLDQAEVKLALALMPADAANTPKWVDLAQGLIALGQLQPDNRELQGLAKNAKAEAALDGKAAALIVSVEKDKLMQVIARKSGEKKK